MEQVNQLERACMARSYLKDLFPQIVAHKDILRKVLTEAPDGSIDEKQFERLREVQECSSAFLLSLILSDDLEEFNPRSTTNRPNDE